MLSGRVEIDRPIKEATAVRGCSLCVQINWIPAVVIHDDGGSGSSRFKGCTRSICDGESEMMHRMSVKLL